MMTRRRRPWLLYLGLAAAALPALVAVTRVPGSVWAVAGSVAVTLIRVYLTVSEHVWAVLAAAALAVAARLAYGAVRFALLPREAKRNYPAAVWHRFRWRWLAQSTGLAWLDKAQHAVRPVAVGTGAPLPVKRPARSKLRFPRARFRATAYGIEARVKVIPQAGREEFDQAAEHIANAWRCLRVSVSQPAPGVVRLRGLRRDPLAEVVPASVLPAFDGRHLWLGRDEFSDLRRADLANISGSVLTGNPGRGKTEAALSLAVQLVPSPLVRTFILDGGGGTDWSVWEPAVTAYCGDDLEAAEDFLLERHQDLMDRRHSLRAEWGTGNAWSLRPSPDYPLTWLLVEECPWFFDLDVVKGDPKKERRVRACRGLAGHLLKRGRAVKHHTTLVAQKGTGSAGLPPDLRDLAGLRWSFGVSTTEAAVAGLGDDIRRYESMSPVLLQGPEHVGVATVLMQTGLDPFTRVKFPQIGDQLAAHVAAQTVARRAEGFPAGPPVSAPGFLVVSEDSALA